MITRILFLDNNLSFSGGGSLVLLRHLQHLDRTHFQPYLGHSQQDSPEVLQPFKEQGAKCFPIFFGRLKTWNLILSLCSLIKTIRALKKTIKQEQIKIVMANSTRACLVGAIAKLITRCRLIWMIREYRFNKLAFKLLSALADKRIYISHGLLKQFSTESDKDQLIFDGTDIYTKLDVINATAVSQQKQAWGNPRSVIGFVGRLVHLKGTIILVQAFELLKQQHQLEAKLVIIGTGQGQNTNQESELKNYVQTHGLNNDVIFTGYRQDVPLLLSCLDLCCFPNILPEGFGIAMIEAKVAGVPVIASDLPEYNYTIKSDTGVLVKPNSPSDLAKAILDLISNPLKRQDLSGQAKIYARHNYDFKIMNQALEQIYYQLGN